MELLIGSIGVILSLFFASYLLITRRQQPLANIFLALYLLAFGLRIGKSLFYNYIPIDPVIRNVFLGVLLAVGPSLWFYTKYRFRPEASYSSPNVLIHYLPMLLFIGCCEIIPNDGSPLSGVFYKLLIGHIVLYAVYSLFWLYRQPKTNLSDRGQKIVRWLYYFLTVTLVIVTLYYLISIRVIPYYMGMAFLFSLVVIFFSFWALKNPFLFKVEPKKYSNSGLSPEEIAARSKRLNALMDEEKLYLDPELTLLKLADTIGITSKQLSQVINQTYKINYSQYIASFRIEEAKKRLNDSKHAHYTIAAIAYDSGFNSLSSFNAAFKKFTKQTAQEFRNRA